MNGWIFIILRDLGTNFQQGVFFTNPLNKGVFQLRGFWGFLWMKTKNLKSLFKKSLKLTIEILEIPVPFKGSFRKPPKNGTNGDIYMGLLRNSQHRPFSGLILPHLIFKVYNAAWVWICTPIICTYVFFLFKSRNL